MSGLGWMRPWLWPWLLLLPALGVALWQLWRWQARGAHAFGAGHVERAPAPLARAALWTAAAGLLLATWMEPLLGEERVPVERRGLDVIFCLDASRSMLARDLDPDRLSRAKRDIQAVLPHLVGGDRAALVAFAGQTRLVMPLTHDLDAFRQLLATVDTDTVRTGGSDLAGAIRRALDLTDAEHAATSVIVLLTDGEDLEGAGKQAAAEARDRGVVVHCVGYGSTRGSKIVLAREGKEAFLENKQGGEVVSAMDADGLRAIAQATGGELVRADVMPLPLVELKQKRMDPMLKRTFEAGLDTLPLTRYQWVLLPAFVLLLLEMLRNGGRR